MKWNIASAITVMFGLFGLFIIFLFQDITVSSEDDYYLLKEITEASMYDSIDEVYFKKSFGRIKINQEKFIEVFTRRFAESSTLSYRGYEIEFIDIIEDPPKVTIRVKNKTRDYTINGDKDFNITNELSAIIETKYS